MEKSKAKYAAKSIWSGTINRLVTMIFPFIVRTMMIYTIGAQYLGLSSIFTSILQILSFTELGIGNVMVFSMYKPIAENDTATICALYNLYKRLYRIIGTVMLGIGLAILPMINHFVSGEAPADINLYVLYLVYLFNSVISYWLFAYKDALISAHQKYYLSSNVSTFSSMFEPVPTAVEFEEERERREGTELVAYADSSVAQSPVSVNLTRADCKTGICLKPLIRRKPRSASRKPAAA